MRLALAAIWVGSGAGLLALGVGCWVLGIGCWVFAYPGMFVPAHKAECACQSHGAQAAAS